MDRPSTTGLASLPAGRLKIDNGTPRTAPLITTRRTPKMLRSTVSNSSLSSQPSMSPYQFIALAREAMKNALEENRSKAVEAKSVSNELKPGVTIDLSHKLIQRFPDEVVDIIKNELERLALSHNQISVFPSRFSECKSLRYLNVRNNIIREFPLCICELPSLEILDFGRNKLKVLPPQIVKLSTLKVLSIQKNRIEMLPLCLADMASLQVLKLDGNPIRFPPKEILQPQSGSSFTGFSPDNEFDEPTITINIKKFLKQKQISDRSEQEVGVGESGEVAETIRPIKRAFSGRFPIKVNGAEVSDVRSPALARPPPIPSRSHYRGLSQQNSALRRPSIMPLAIGNANERLRSNSEVIFHPQREQRIIRQLRRISVYPRIASDLDTVDETKSNRYSHYRGLSHGSAMTGNQANVNSNFKSPLSPTDSMTQPTNYVRRLSSLPESKRESILPDLDVEAAKSILYALFQVHPLIQSLLGVARDGTNKRTSLERVLYNASTHVVELDKTIQDFMIPSKDEDEGSNSRSSENVRHACVTCVNAYIHVLNLLQSNIDSLIENVDPRYVRTLLLLLYGSTCEIHAAHSKFIENGGPESRKELRSAVKPSVEGNPQSRPREKTSIPSIQRSRAESRKRSATVIQALSPNHIPFSSHLHPTSNGSRSFTISSNNSQETYRSLSSSGTPILTSNFNEEDRMFDKIFLQVQQTLEITIKAMPSVCNQFITAMKANNQQSVTDQSKDIWQTLTQKSLSVTQKAEMVKHVMSSIKLREPGTRTHGRFWELCYSMIKTFTELVLKVKEAKSITTLLSNDVIITLRPLQKSIKETSRLIQSSPWSYLASKSNSRNNEYDSEVIT
ncbi:putative ram signaling pathway protein [Erysiphe neolycopersici]|uniref:Putative ram signaling pathway protein n=1 Tax=Erysiphe neolycopersici TaxID=212602 RepID=A0A420HFG9_9PEZI|nr:putative ram signaling pathway protein [Erysiphe neolycopersici]